MFLVVGLVFPRLGGGDADGRRRLRLDGVASVAGRRGVAVAAAALLAVATLRSFGVAALLGLPLVALLLSIVSNRKLAYQSSLNL